ncbi:NmrA-like family protein [Aspergillus ustus]|uniref:NmrA-like family protein n=1 Tax=Aspergillus ustus TaxID=40382 RepID=A0A0C1BVI1_ASPUT|nr:NmrA-like family protein [Aspergillus ustus]
MSVASNIHFATYPPMSSISSILVLGAGELGTYVLHSLAQHPLRSQTTTISVLLRESSINSNDESKAMRLVALRNLGITFTSGDLVQDSEDELSSTFRNFDVVICCTGYMAASGLQLKISRAVLSAGVPFYVPWQFGMDYEAIGRGYQQYMFDEQLNVRDLLRAQTGSNNTRWVALSTGLFSSVIFPPIGGLVDMEKRVVYGVGDWNRQFSTTTPEDIGKFTAELVLGPERDTLFAVNGPVYVAGDTVSYNDVAHIVEDVAGQSFTRRLLTLEETEHDMNTELTAARICRNVLARGRGALFQDTDLWTPSAGLKVSSLDDFAKRYLPAFFVNPV